MFGSKGERIMKRTITLTVALAILACCGATRADPVTTEVKWSQPVVWLGDIDPEYAGTTYIYGWDQSSMQIPPDYPIPSPKVADDFECNDPRPVVDLHWWGSYPAGVPVNSPNGFLIEFWTDVPESPPFNPFSHPGEVIHTIDCRTYTEQWVGEDIDVVLYDLVGFVSVVDQCYQYNQRLDPAEYFYQDPGTIYWLSIQAYWDDPDEFTDWGWKTRPWYFNDDAVTGFYDPELMAWSWQEVMGGDPVRSWDLAFELSVPEPATLSVIALGGLALLRRRRR